MPLNMKKSEKIYSVCVVGSGLAGSECAYQLAKRGIDVALIEMRPKKLTPAHHTGNAAELVCSNSLRSNDIMNAVGLLKEEMASLDSLIIKSAYKSRVPAGSALAVDREAFSKFVSDRLSEFDQIDRYHEEVIHLKKSDDLLGIYLEDGRTMKARYCVLATGPLTADHLSKWIAEKTGQDYLYFYDSIAPIVEKDSIDMNVAFLGSRWDRGEEKEGDYINCPMTQEQYENFIHEIQNAELAEVKDFDKAQFFEGCLPIEVMASRGLEVLRYGPMKPVGIKNPQKPEVDPYAVVQLRQDNLHATLYNMVGFQTRMKWGEQKRIFQMIPGLENAEFVRMGSMHRNTYICSPILLKEGMELKSFSHLHFAGQITGCEGYVESAAVGLYVGNHLVSQIQKKKKLPLPPNTTALGALAHHILKADPDDYQPMNINFGLFQPLEGKIKKFDKKMALVKRACLDFRKWQFDHVED